MTYVGMQTQINRNNRLSVLLLLSFPCIMLGMVWVFLAIINYIEGGTYDLYGNIVHQIDTDVVNAWFLHALPWVVGIVAVWFAIAYCGNAAMVRQATGARPLTRKENPRIYNIVENLTMAAGMDMPKINVVDDPQLNAFASGIDRNSYTVTLTTGIIDLLDDQELAGVIGHELTHIRNHDTRLLITSIVFVGIVATIMSMIVRMMYYMFWFGDNRRSRDDDERGNGVGMVVMLLVGLVCCAIAYFFTLITRFAISRKREYMADAGGAELCGNPLALASALRKISGDPGLQGCKHDDVAQLFIVHPQGLKGGPMSFFSSLFATHPDTEKRIAILEQF